MTVTEKKIYPVSGINIGASSSGLRFKNRLDLALFEITPCANVTCFFTKNRYAAAPVVVAKENLSAGSARYLVVNSGNANAGLGSDGIIAAQEVCNAVASEGQCNSKDVIPFSTGVIGEPLDYLKICAAIPSVFSTLNENNWQNAAKAIMTTDTFPKIRSLREELDNDEMVVTGIAKGSGMIRPNMATMLSYVGTNASLSKDLAYEIGLEALNTSFNRITVDGETSTNDAFVLISTGSLHGKIIQSVSDSRFQNVLECVLQVTRGLSKDIVRDGEGATKLVSINVVGANSEDDALKVAYAVAESSLVKTAMFAEDPNWGRILSAIGASDAKKLDFSKVDLSIGANKVVSKGSLVKDYVEKKVRTVMETSEYNITISLNLGSDCVTVWTCDLSYDYVKINAEYRT